MIGSVAGRYRVRSKIADGGMATVMLADDEVLGRPVALKRLHPHISADAAQAARFEQEALLAASLTHPGVVTVLDAGKDEEGSFLVMEFVDGETLQDRLSRGPLPPGEAAGVAADAARALQHAHERGLVHRDVKPGNVMLTRDGRTKIGDFGIAKALDADGGHTATGKFVGTAAYISPEQAEGKPATPASDLYALGVVLYEMLAGRKPFEGTPVAMAIAHRTRPVPPLDEAVPPGLRDVVERALAKDPEARFVSAAAMADALAPFTEPEGAAAAEAGPATRQEETDAFPVTEPAPEAASSSAAHGGRHRRPGRRVAILLAGGSLALLLLLTLLFWVPARGQDRTPPAPRRSPSTAVTETPSTPDATTVSPTPSATPTASPTPSPTRTGGGGGGGSPTPTAPSPTTPTASPDASPDAGVSPSPGGLPP